MMSHNIMYNDFIENEKILSSKFLLYEQIFDNRFDESDYIIIKKIFENDLLINKIYCVIDKIVLQENLDFKSRFLIIGDFLFSMGSLDLKNPYNIVLKTSRNEYIGRIIERAEINSIFDYDYSKYIKIHKKLLIGLRKYDILQKNVIRLFKDDWETIIYFKLNINIDYLENIMPVDTSKNPFRVSYNKRYSIGSFRNIWKLKRKKREMEDFDICTLSVIKSNTIKFSLSRELYDINRELIEKEAENMLKSVNCSNLEEYFKKVKEALNNKDYDYNIWNKLKTSNKKINEYNEIMNIYQKMVSMSIIKRDIFDKVIYLPCFFDNRGRQYYGSIVSPTFYIIFRYMYIFVENKDFKNLEQSRFYNKILEYKYKIDYLNLSERNSYIALIFLIEIGKFYIKTEEYMIKTEEIIESGLRNYNKEYEELKFGDRLYLNKIKVNLIKLLKGEEFDKNTIIFKDATASGLQNYGIILGYKEDKLEYLNLNGNNWCDTYKYLIDKFLENSKFSKRKYWKGTIMTIPYNAVWFSCFEKFIEALRKDGIEYKNMNNQEKDEIKEVHRKMYYKIKNDLKSDLFIKNEGKLVNFKYNEWRVVNRKEYKINFEKARDKYVDTTYILIEDEKASKTALEANNMHYLDAILIKYILEDLDIIPIHDCFGIRLCELHLLVDKINKYYSNKIGKDTYSIHVIK